MLKNCLCLIFITLIGCSKKMGSDSSENIETKEFQNEEVILGLSESVKIDSNLITFEKVINDSRCPKGGECVDQGFAIVEISVFTSGQKKVSYQLNTKTENKIELNDINIELAELSPHPKVGVEIQKDNYRVQLKKLPNVKSGLR